MKNLKYHADGWGRLSRESLVHTITLKVFGYHWKREEQATTNLKSTQNLHRIQKGGEGFKGDDCQIIKNFGTKSVN